MSKTPRSFLATGCILLIALAPAAFGQNNGTLLFESDFAPTAELPHDPEIYAPNWDPDAPFDWAYGVYPNVIWQDDAGRASPQSTNGFWKELVRGVGEDTGPINFTTVAFPVDAHQGELLVVRFDFKVGTDTTVNNGQVNGRLDLRFVESVGEEAGGVAHEMTLIDVGNVITNEQSPGGSTDFDWEITDLGDGWVNIELTARTIGANSEFARIWIAPWVGIADFEGSIGIDNLVVYADGFPPEPPPATGIEMGVFSTSFEPTDAMPFDEEVFSADDPTAPNWVYPPGWGGQFGLASANYPQAVWRNEPDWAAEDSNGYFLEGRREAGDTSLLYIRSLGIPQSSGPVTLQFDFKLGADPDFNGGVNDGRLDFRVEHWGPGWNVESMMLANNGVVRGEEGTAGWEISNNFQSIEISEPDANGWRTYTIVIASGVMRSVDDFVLFFAPWTFADPNAGGHFQGSYGIDNAEVRFALPTPVALDLTRDAVEVEFFGEAGKLYRIQSRNSPQDEWVFEEEIITGADAPVFRLFSKRDEPQREFRVLSD